MYHDQCVVLELAESRMRLWHDVTARKQRMEATALRARRERARDDLTKNCNRFDDQDGNRGALAEFVDVCLATAEAYIKRAHAYTIDIIRGPIYPLLYFFTLLLTYRVSGRTSVDGMSAAGFLFVGTIGIELWQSNLWASGYAIETERYSGTLPALLLSPASRGAVIIGYALGSFVTILGPSLLFLLPAAFLTHANFQVRDPLAVLLAVLSLAGASVALGYGLSGLFVLTHRANLLANFFQSPIYLLSGMVVPISALPGPLRTLAEIFPISFGMTALRRALLSGASVADISGELFRVVLASLVLAVIGAYFLRRVEHVAKRGAELDYI